MAVRTRFCAICSGACVDTGETPPEAAPWHTIFYNDEIGLSPLKYDSRKVEFCYWSFLEFGPAALGAEELWFCITAVRSSRVCQLPAGISHVTKAALRLFLLGDHNIQRGVMLDVRGQHVCLIAKHACHISDEKPLRGPFARGVRLAASRAHYA